LKQPTLADVAKYAGVTSAAASYYFRGKKKLSQERESKLAEAAALFKYTPMHIRSMPEANRNIQFISICCIIESNSDINDIYYFSQMNGVLEYLINHNHQLTVNYLVEGDQASNDRFFSSLEFVKGVILSNPRTDHRIEDELKRRKIPYVVLGTPGKTESPYYVDIDMQGAGFQAADYLLEKGHQRILYLNLPESMLQSQQRHDGFVLAYKQRGLNFNDADHFYTSVSADICCQIAKKLLAAPGRYTAVVTSNEIQAQGVIRAAKELNIKIPSKLSIVSMGGTMLGTLSTPPLTTIDFRPHEIGYEGAKLLLDILGKKRIQPFYLILPGNLVERGSTK
jgi:DNA-binding LacI/PurR family transcriptional regulator